MSLQIPNLDRVTKDDAKTGEALKRVQDYANLNVTPVAGNAIAAPPQTGSTTSSSTASTPVPAVRTPTPPKGIKTLVQP